VLDLFAVIVLIVDESEFTLLLHTVVDHKGQVFLMLLLKLINGVPDLLVDLLTALLVLGDKSLDLLAKLTLGGLELLSFKLVVTEHLLDLLLLKFCDVLDAHLVLGVLSLLCLMKVLEALVVGLDLLLLVPHAVIQLDLVVFHKLSLALLVFTFLFLFLGFEIGVALLTESLFDLNLLLKLSDLQILLLANVLSLIILRLLHKLNLIVKMFNF